MKKAFKFSKIITFLVVIGLSFFSCDSFTDNNNKGNNNGGYKIGDTGPGGGIIFFDKGGFSEGWRYLEAATVNLGEIRWSSDVWANVTGTEASIGSGKNNTALIIASNPDDTLYNNAAKACVDYRGGNKDDWFLPSINELKELWKQKSYFNLTNEVLWSSTQFNDYLNQNTFAEVFYFSIGSSSWDGKEGSNYFRPIRAF